MLLIEAVQTSAGTQRCSLWMEVDTLLLGFQISSDIGANWLCRRP